MGLMWRANLVSPYQKTNHLIKTSVHVNRLILIYLFLHVRQQARKKGLQREEENDIICERDRS